MNFRTVFHKETLNESRRLRSYLLRVAYVALVFGLIVLFYGGQLQNLGVTVSPEEQQTKLTTLATGLYTFTAWAQILLAVLITPILVTASFQSEKRYGTLDLLSMTQLRDRDVVLGKVFSKYLIVLVLIMAGVPVLTMIKVFGYVDIQLVLGNFFCSVSMMLISGAAGAYFGLSSQNLLTAIRNTYLLLVGYVMAGYIIGYVVVRMVFNDSSVFGAHMCDFFHYVINPAYAQFYIIGMQSLTTAEQVSQPVFAVLVTVQVLVAMLVSWFYLNRAELQYRWWRLGLSPQGQAFAARQAVKIPGTSATTPPENSIVARHGLYRSRSKRTAFGVLMAVLSIESVAFLVGLAATEPTIHILSISAQFLVLAVTVAVVAGAAIAQETEDGSMVVLLTTPLSSDEIVWQKLRGLGTILGWPMAVMTAHLGLFSVLGKIDIIGALILALTLPAFVGLMVVICTSISAIMATPSRAIAYSVAFLIVITLGTYMIGVLVAAAGTGAPTDSMTVAGNFITHLNPMVLIGETIRPGYGTGTIYHRIEPVNLWRVLPAAAAVVLMLVIGMQILRMRFQTWVRRHIGG